MPLLPENYTVGPNDVIIGRGKRCTQNPGNQRFRSIIQTTLDAYQNAETKVKKSDIIMEVLNQIRADNGVGFVKIDAGTGRFVQVEEASCRIAIAQAFRDALSGTYKSSKKHKQMRRLERKRACATNFLATRFMEEQKQLQLQHEPVSRSIFDETDSMPCLNSSVPKSPIRSASSGMSMFQLRDILQQASQVTFPSDDSEATLAFAAFQSTVEATIPQATIPQQPQVTPDLFSSLLQTMGSQSVNQVDPFEPTPIANTAFSTGTYNEQGPRAA